MLACNKLPAYDNNSPSDDETDNNEGSTLKSSIVGIIHVHDVTTPTSLQVINSSGSDSQSSASQVNSVQQQQQAAADSSQSTAAELQANDTTNTNSSKVILIYFPARQASLNSNNSSDATQSNNSKRPRFDQSESQTNTSDTSSQGTFRFTPLSHCLSYYCTYPQQQTTF